MEILLRLDAETLQVLKDLLAKEPGKIVFERPTHADRPYRPDLEKPSVRSSGPRSCTSRS